MSRQAEEATQMASSELVALYSGLLDGFGHDLWLLRMAKGQDMAGWRSRPRF